VWRSGAAGGRQRRFTRVWRRHCQLGVIGQRRVGGRAALVSCCESEENTLSITSVVVVAVVLRLQLTLTLFFFSTLRDADPFRCILQPDTADTV